MDLEHLLVSAGLSDRESKVYLALLELGDSPVAAIAEKARFQRPNCYDILEELVQKGLASYYLRNKWRRYVAEDPKVLSKLIQERAQMVAAALPDLRSIYNRAPHKPKVRYYEGKDGIKQIYEQVLLAKSYDNIYRTDAVTPIFGDYVIEFGQRVAAAGIQAREIVVTDQRNLPQHQSWKKPLQQVRYLPSTTNIYSDILIYENKLAIVSYAADPHAVMIEESGIVDTHREMFEYMWQAAKT